MMPKSTIDTMINSYYRYRTDVERLRTKERARQWKLMLPKLKKVFEEAGITRCEQCLGTFALSFAHRLKRREISTLKELETVSLLCQKCHEQVEHSGHEEMYERITSIIDNRRTPVRELLQAKG